MTTKNAVRDHMFSAAGVLGQKLTLVELLCITYATNWLPGAESFLRPFLCRSQEPGRHACTRRKNRSRTRIKGNKSTL